MKTVTAKLGKTTYEAKQNAGNIVQITRRNSDGEKVVFVPVSLLIAFVAELKREQVTDRDLLGLKP